MTEALRGWPVEETIGKVVWTKNRLLPYLGHPGRFSREPTLAKSRADALWRRFSFPSYVRSRFRP